ncbi:DUF4214 domain-containing protein [Pseudoduganella sp. FT93W]|uniref:DUF4214 domain-containing protein n=1 Tax=Duganella fentianensis TaxID=2692177 RepID=A0A845I3E4_9BURK|nr:DUF4214 domain-containing protein [Duganella fentianensis]
MATVNINLGSSTIQNVFNTQGSPESLNLADLVDPFFGANYFFTAQHPRYFGRGYSATEVQLDYLDGASSSFTGVTLANPTANEGDATLTQLVHNLPNTFRLSANGKLNFHYNNDAGLFYGTSATLNDAELKFLLPESAAQYNKVSGNATLGLHGAVTVLQSDNFSGTLNSITLSTEKTIASAAINGNFTIGGNSTSIAYERSTTAVTGQLDNVLINYRDGSQIKFDQLNMAVDSHTDIEEGLLSNAANFGGNDTFNVTLASRLDHTLQLATGSGNDRVVLKGGAETLAVNAGSGNDVITLLDHFHLVDGGSGSDTVVLAGPRDSYQISRNGNSLLVQSKAFAGGTDTLTNVERLMFDDDAVAYDIAGTGGQLYRLYQAAFNRAPDKGGLGFWMHQMDQGTSLDTIASFFTSSPEFQSMYGSNLSNAALVDKLYQNVLHRAGDAGGITFWNDYLDHRGGTQAKTLAYFGESAENQAALASVIGNGFSYTPYG